MNSSATLDQIRKKIRSLEPLFILFVLTPTFFSILYFGLIASNVYISESRFLIRAPEKQGFSGLGALFRGGELSSGGDEGFAVQDYVRSRDALKALNGKNAVLEIYTRPNIDFWNRISLFQSSISFEDLFGYFKEKVNVAHDPSSSITTLTVRAYTPEDAFWINEHLLERSEALVNRLNSRAQEDLVRFATTEVEGAQRRATGAAIALARYRNSRGVIDPERQAVVQVQLISKLQDELIETQTQIAQLSQLAPQNPQLDVLRSRAIELANQMNKATGNVAGQPSSLAGSAAPYQRLVLETQFADRQLASAMATLEQARNEARRKQAYLERIVEPNQPDAAMEPRRLRGIFSTFALGLLLWGIIRILAAGLREHQE